MTVTRASLSEALYRRVGLSRVESAALVDQFLLKLSEHLDRGDSVKISLFGSFVVRSKKARIGRNPKTGEEVPMMPRRVLLFRPSSALKKRMNLQFAQEFVSLS